MFLDDMSSITDALRCGYTHNLNTDGRRPWGRPRGRTTGLPRRPSFISAIDALSKVRENSKLSSTRGGVASVAFAVGEEVGAIEVLGLCEGWSVSTEIGRSDRLGLFDIVGA